MSASETQQPPTKAKFKIVYDMLDRYPEACRNALAVGLKHAVKEDTCYIPVWVEEREALIVLDSENDAVCYGVMQWSTKLESHGSFYINWAHCNHPQAFVLMAMAARKAAREMGAKAITFEVYSGNKRMHRLAQIFGASPRSISYRLGV